MRLNFILLVTLFIPGLVCAQDKLNEISVDRPGIAESPFTVAPKNFQLETGFEYYKRTNEVVEFLPVT
jgi:amino acid permease